MLSSHCRIRHLQQTKACGQKQTRCSWTNALKHTKAPWRSKAPGSLSHDCLSLSPFLDLQIFTTTQFESMPLLHTRALNAALENMGHVFKKRLPPAKRPWHHDLSIAAYLQIAADIPADRIIVLNLKEFQALYLQFSPSCIQCTRGILICETSLSSGFFRSRNSMRSETLSTS